MKRKQAVKEAIKITGQIGLECLKEVGLITGANGIVLIGLALIKPNIYKK